MKKQMVIATIAVFCLGGGSLDGFAANDQPAGSVVDSNAANDSTTNNSAGNNGETTLSNSAEPLAPMPPIDTYDAIISRPIFHSSRRPKPVENSATATTDSELQEQWRLTGVVLREPPIALFTPKNTGAEPKRVEAGMALVPNWLLDEVGPDYVLLSDGDEQIRFELWQPRALALPATQRDSKPEIISRPVRPQLVPETTEKTVTPEPEQ